MTCVVDQLHRFQMSRTYCQRRGIRPGFSRWRSLRKRVFQGLPVGLPTIPVAIDLNASKQHDFDHRGTAAWQVPRLDAIPLISILDNAVSP